LTHSAGQQEWPEESSLLRHAAPPYHLARGLGRTGDHILFVMD